MLAALGSHPTKSRLLAYEESNMPVIQNDIAMGIDNILLATDFSVASEKAAEYAKALAKRFLAAVEIAHVFDPSKVTSYEEAILSLPLADRRQNSYDYLEPVRNDFTDAGIETRTVAPEGHWAGAEILKVAEDDHVDLIVTGTESKHGVERWLLGSTAEEILRRASCPVLTVGPNVKSPKAGALVFKSIVFATDFSVQSAKAAAIALSFAEDGGARLFFCHVVASKPGSQSEKQMRDDMFQAALEKLVPNSSYDWCSPECVLEHGDAAKGILAAAERLHADLIVLGPRKASFWLDHVEHGTTPNLLAKATCPVLTVC